LSGQIILGTDPGQRFLGYCVTRYVAQRRDVLAQGSLADVDAEKLVRWFFPLLKQYRPDVVAIEDYVWQGADRSGNSNAFLLSRLVGDIEGAALMWSAASNGDCTRVLRVSKSEANAFIGLTGKTPKSRVETAMAAYFPGVTFKDQHARDAALVTLSGRKVA
jgi:Holliday junction resolvasome RuvABC endonuclease subunit